MSAPKKPAPPDAPTAAPAELEVSESSAPPPTEPPTEESTSSTESATEPTPPDGDADAGTDGLEVSPSSEPQLAHVVDRDAAAAADEERKNAAWIEALEFERLGYERFGREARVAEVDAQLEIARKRTTASSKPTTKR